MYYFPLTQVTPFSSLNPQLIDKKTPKTKKAIIFLVFISQPLCGVLAGPKQTVPSSEPLYLLCPERERKGSFTRCKGRQREEVWILKGTDKAFIKKFSAVIQPHGHDKYQRNWTDVVPGKQVRQAECSASWRPLTAVKVFQNSKVCKQIWLFFSDWNPGVRDVVIGMIRVVAALGKTSEGWWTHF